MEQKNQFDDKAIQGLDLLFHHYWILRNEHPEWYRLVREREKVLRRYVDDKFGLRLIVHQHFVKLEKIPVVAESWMGIDMLQEPMDYAIFCSALAFLESKSVNEQFLLSELGKEIIAYYPEGYTLDWTTYTHRKSLVRAIKALLDFRLMRTVDGDVEQFERDEEQEVLYEVTVYSRYFMRTYPDDFSSFQNWQELLHEDWVTNQEDLRRKRVYRQLFFSPGIHREDGQDSDFQYIRYYRNRLAEDIEKHSDYQLHIYKNTAFLAIAEPKRYHQVFPDKKAMSDIVLLVARYFHEQKERFPSNEYGKIMISTGQLEQMLDQLRAENKDKWSSELKNMSTASLRNELLSTMKKWRMIEIDEATAFIHIQSLAGVIAGDYAKEPK